MTLNCFFFTVMRKNVAKVYENFTFLYKSKVSLGSVSRFYLDISSEI